MSRRGGLPFSDARNAQMSDIINFFPQIMLFEERKNNGLDFEAEAKKGDHFYRFFVSIDHEVQGAKRGDKRYSLCEINRFSAGPDI